MSRLHRRTVVTEEMIATEITRVKGEGDPDGCVVTLEYLLAVARTQPRHRREALRLAQRGLEMQAERGQADGE